MLSIVLTLALAGSSSTVLLPQTARPDFSGRWVDQPELPRPGDQPDPLRLRAEMTREFSAP